MVNAVGRVQQLTVLAVRASLHPPLCRPYHSSASASVERGERVERLMASQAPRPQLSPAARVSTPMTLTSTSEEGCLHCCLLRGGAWVGVAQEDARARGAEDEAYGHSLRLLCFLHATPTAGTALLTQTLNPTSALV
jgi:hypothetical protein